MGGHDGQGYDERARLLAEKLRPLRPDVDPEDPASEDWAVIGISRGGLPLAVHLPHLLGCRVFGSVWLWKYRKGERNAAVIDGLYTPRRDANGSPGTLLVVDDVVASGHGLALVTRLLRDRYGNPPVRILKASLLRDVQKAPLSHDSVTAEEYEYEVLVVPPLGGAPRDPSGSGHDVLRPRAQQEGD